MSRITNSHEFSGTLHPETETMNRITEVFFSFVFDKNYEIFLAFPSAFPFVPSNGFLFTLRVCFQAVCVQCLQNHQKTAVDSLAGVRFLFEFRVLLGICGKFVCVLKQFHLIFKAQ